MRGEIEQTRSQPTRQFFRQRGRPRPNQTPSTTATQLSSACSLGDYKRRSLRWGSSPSKCRRQSRLGRFQQRSKAEAHQIFENSRWLPLHFWATCLHQLDDNLWAQRRIDCAELHRCHSLPTEVSGFRVCYDQNSRPVEVEKCRTCKALSLLGHRGQMGFLSFISYRMVSLGVTHSHPDSVGHQREEKFNRLRSFSRSGSPYSGPTIFQYENQLVIKEEKIRAFELRAIRHHILRELLPHHFAISTTL